MSVLKRNNLSYKTAFINYLPEILQEQQNYLQHGQSILRVFFGRHKISDGTLNQLMISYGKGFPPTSVDELHRRIVNLLRTKLNDYLEIRIRTVKQFCTETSSDDNSTLHIRQEIVGNLWPAIDPHVPLLLMEMIDALNQLISNGLLSYSDNILLLFEEYQLEDNWIPYYRKLHLPNFRSMKLLLANIEWLIYNEISDIEDYRQLIEYKLEQIEAGRFQEVVSCPIMMLLMICA